MNDKDKINKIIIINGYNGSGKDEFIKQFDRKYFNRETEVIGHSTIDIYKGILKNQFGWNGEKDEKSREALQRLKEFHKWYNDGPFVSTCAVIEYWTNEEISHKYNFIFIHSREPEEIKRLKEKYNAITLLIDRDSAIPANNSSDMSVKMTEYDYTVYNNGTIDNLKEDVHVFYDWMIANG